LQWIELALGCILVEVNRKENSLSHKEVALLFAVAEHSPS
jgi:hypothetical protein